MTIDPGAVTGEELLIIAAARRLRGGSCFVGIGLPSAAAILAQRLHAPDLFLVYESGVLGVRPAHLPLSVADGVLADSALATVGVVEMFNVWLQPGRIDVGILGGAQVDRLGNINSTVIGPYSAPKVRLPGAGGAPEIAAACGSILVLMAQSVRSFVPAVDFRTTIGFGDGPGFREGLGLRGGGVAAVITDIGRYEPDPVSCELVLTGLQPGRSVDDAVAATGWPLRVAASVEALEPPTPAELGALRSLRAGH